MADDTQKDAEQAFLTHKKAAELGDAEAQYKLGVCYYYGDGVAEDKEEAFKWSKKSAEQGFAPAQFNLGVSYCYGDGVAEDETEAVKWFTKSAKQGDAKAQFNLGVCYYYGDGVTEDKTEAVKWFTKSAKQGDAKAQYNLGDCYETGTGVAKDYEKAVEWYRKSAEQGYAQAQYNLGYCYETGTGVAKDKAKACKWYKKSAEQGDADAQYKLGLCYYYGNGVAEDKEKAMLWFKKSAEQGDADAQCYVEDYTALTGATQDRLQAFEKYAPLAEQGNVYALYNPRLCCRYGAGVAEQEETRQSCDWSWNARKQRIYYSAHYRSDFQKIAQQVKISDVLITDGTHRAVGLRYDNETMSAPEITLLCIQNEVPFAKWIAFAHGIAVETNRQLSAELYHEYYVGEQIIEDDHLHSVAKVYTKIHWLEKSRVR